MPTAAKKSGTSRSTSRSRGKSRTRSKSRSRSRSRSRGRSPSRKTTAAKPKVSTPKVETSVLTPRRKSARIAAIETEKEVVKTEEVVVTTTRSKVEPPTSKSKLCSMCKVPKNFLTSIGCLFFMAALPVFMYTVLYSCSKKKCVLSLPKIPKDISQLKGYFEIEASGIWFGWFAAQVFLSLLPIGKIVEGANLKNGGKLKYRCNGFYTLLINILIFAAAVYFKCPVTRVLNKLVPIVTTATLFAFVVSVFLYIKARRWCPVSKLSPDGNTGNILVDFIMGHELNPRIRSFDFKLVFMRSAVITLVLLNLLFVVRASELYGKPSPALLMLTVFQILYAADILWFEESLLTQMDVMYGGFGFFQTFACLAFMPATMPIQGRFLLEHNFSLPWYCLAGIAVLNFIGYFIYRGANSQKNDFRRNPHSPSLAHLETISTSSGKKLLVSGWWGICRKPNYLGDILMSVAWSLTCGFTHVLPYMYPALLFLGLIYRERQDNSICQKKYRSSWDKYCDKVKYRIFPRIY